MAHFLMTQNNNTSEANMFCLHVSKSRMLTTLLVDNGTENFRVLANSAWTKLYNI